MVFLWLPMRFMAQVLRELFFFEKELSWNSSVSTLVWIGVVSMLVVIASALKLNSIEEKKQTEKLAA
ncbi:hypothetical protein [Bacillus mycoides]|uniref:hypothetical protein n=2 Tax=Bacillus mycoides TaxID=1405 RepID=UPI001C01E89E|nr:hypothetical protein [Bacillus mycoides]QWH54163.1 hypothetical protein EXW44_29400 [Bacillus mycoides]QWI57999.1 hypothetical protein EXW42_28555 [Bacillus mycoides]QWI92632.1 hypothetical protein J5W00_28695 [Bacillus mycoides]QWJ03548.1 hypothetical protein J5V93_28880 [Bacillus mycoides]